MCQCFSNRSFPSLGSPNRIWSIPSIHGNLRRLRALHDAIFERLTLGDRIIYLGNYTGHGDQSAETIDEILTFRRMVLSKPGMRTSDLIYLRGKQETMWSELTQLHFNPNPVDTLVSMLGNGVSATLNSYALSAHDGIMAAREGTMSLTRWTSRVIDHVRRFPGHDMFMSNTCRAAYTEMDDRFPILFVNAGINAHKPLQEQHDALWFGGEDFNDMIAPYNPFEKVIRGFDPQKSGLYLNGVAASLDGGCGFGGSLIGAGITPEGDILELLEA